MGASASDERRAFPDATPQSGGETIEVRVRLFARLRQVVGSREVSLALPAGSSIADAWAALVARYPGLEQDGPFVRFARNGVYAGTGQQLADGDELACIPPVSGGSGGAGGVGGTSRTIVLTPEPITDDLLAATRSTVATAADGAIVEFIGTTRETPGVPAPGQEEQATRHAGERVVRLEYEAYEELARSVLDEIADEIEERFGVERLAVVHRTGSVAVGEPSVAIVVAAPHRGPAFDACRYAIDELKARAPIWKEEHFASGSVWIGTPARARARDADGDTT